jgi:hypothetical protein
MDSPSKSPNFSVMETWIKPLREKFFEQECWSGEEGVQKFYNVWRELKPEKINMTIDAYPKRLYDCLRVTDGRATKY